MPFGKPVVPDEYAMETPCPRSSTGVTGIGPSAGSSDANPSMLAI